MMKLYARLAVAAVLALAFAAASPAETFYERKPADIFMGKKTGVTVDVVSVAESGTVHAQLSNGMTVLLKENRTAPIAIVQVTAVTGSIYEQEYLGAGISHFFEHLMHGGTTTTRTEEESARILDSIGSNANAYTSTDNTSYFIKVAKGDIDTAIGLLADWMMNTKVTEEEFNREMSVVQRESERANAEPRRILHSLMSETMFRVHPARYPVLGYDHVRAKLALEDVHRYRARMYVPNNMVFTAVGDFDWQDALEKVRAAFDGFEKGALPAISLPAEPEQVSMRVARKSLPDLNVSMLSMGCRTIPLTHPDLYALDVLAAILGQGNSSRLVRLLRDERRLVESIQAYSYTPGYDAGEFVISARISKSENVQPVIDAVRDQIERFKTSLVSKAELERVKNQVAAYHVYSSESIDSQASSLVSGYMSAGDPDFDSRYVAGIAGVTAEQVRRVAGRYFSGDKLCIAIVGPKGEEAAKVVAQKVSEATPVQKSTLPSGLTLLLKRNPEVPVVAFELYFMAGLRAETADTNGISKFAAQLWGRSTKSRKAAKLAAELEGMGASISTDSGNNTIFLRGTCLAKDFDRMLDIVSDATINPAFDAGECEKMRGILLSAIKARDDRIHTQAQRLLQSAFYGADNPYSMDPLGRAETVGKLTAGQLAAFYRAYSRGPNGVLAVYGDIDPVQAERKISK
ncbi:MAG TPA: pitrilysin family protein, partial [Planctomycetota bacterium]|nr:pitrilysin family protein [Planctomycetota bacterium]